MRYVCPICGYVYDEEKEKIPFADLPASWQCPICKAAKSDFGLEQAKAQIDLSEMHTDEPLQELTMGQLSVLCSNLARGCEKQYKAEAAKDFTTLAQYFADAMPKVEDPSLEKLIGDLKQDIDNYASLRTLADANHDRGTARICVWGEKVTRMLYSILQRYQSEGEDMFAGKRIFVCTACGFVYIGEEAPEKCPVCKVSAWKFAEIKGGETA